MMLLEPFNYPELNLLVDEADDEHPSLFKVMDTCDDWYFFWSFTTNQVTSCILQISWYHNSISINHLWLLKALLKLQLSYLLGHPKVSILQQHIKLILQFLLRINLFLELVSLCL